MLESTIVAAIQRWVKRQPDMWAMKIHGHPEQQSGVPDFLICCRGRFVGLEVKLPGKEPTALQAFTLEELQAAGAIVAVVYSRDEAVAILEYVRCHLTRSTDSM